MIEFGATKHERIVSQVIHKAWLAEIRRQLGYPLNAPKADPANRQIDLFNPR
ncbi:hypothetical protein QNL30_02875 [Pseudomonas amygdali pv. morsprunorum]|uniref:Uncharacterized protein n=1 Tax=Pseudomonas amygdali pv. morsprunorum TaxID=129138 RepID=A0AB35QTW9_PSEA0|nr:hypothetical protein [Pseudomonas amygdali]MDT3239612.1 hypothetical protein [Pseudomonas amygdali pv. morsprunorum]